MAIQKASHRQEFPGLAVGIAVVLDGVVLSEPPAQIAGVATIDLAIFDGDDQIHPKPRQAGRYGSGRGWAVFFFEPIEARRASFQSEPG